MFYLNGGYLVITFYSTADPTNEEEIRWKLWAKVINLNKEGKDLINFETGVFDFRSIPPMHIREGSIKNEPLVPEIFEYSIGTLIFQWTEKNDDTPESLYSLWAIIATVEFKPLMSKILLTRKSQLAQMNYNESRLPTSKWDNQHVPFTMWRENDKLWYYPLVFDEQGKPLVPPGILYLQVQDMAFLNALNAYSFIYSDTTREKTVVIMGSYWPDTKRISI